MTGFDILAILRHFTGESAVRKFFTFERGNIHQESFALSAKFTVIRASQWLSVISRHGSGLTQAVHELKGSLIMRDASYTNIFLVIQIETNWQKGEKLQGANERFGCATSLSVINVFVASRRV